MTRIAFQLLTDLSDTKIIGKPAYESSESNTLYQPISEQRNYELKTANKILMWIRANISKAVVLKKILKAITVRYFCTYVKIPAWKAHSRKTQNYKIVLD